MKGKFNRRKNEISLYHGNAHSQYVVEENYVSNLGRMSKFRLKRYNYELMGKLLNWQQQNLQHNNREFNSLISLMISMLLKSTNSLLWENEAKQ